MAKIKSLHYIGGGEFVLIVKKGFKKIVACRFKPYNKYEYLNMTPKELYEFSKPIIEGRNICQKKVDRIVSDYWDK